MFPLKLWPFVFVAAATMVVHPAFAQGGQSSVRKAQALLAGHSGENLLSPAVRNLGPLPEKAAIVGKFRVQSLAESRTIGVVKVGDLDQFSLPAFGRNRARIPGMKHAGLTANRVDKPVELKGRPVPPVPASKLRGDVPPQPVPLP